MAQKHRYRRGNRLGSWRLIEPLGVGGNAEVWEAQHANGIKAALKILRTKNPESEPYKRFTGEIEILRALGKRPGILPVIDASLPESPSQRNPAWLAMPIAIPIAKALGEAPPLESVVRAVAEVAGTLAGLGAEGISHRDVKPDNLYRYEERWVVGDFGLVSFPSKEAITEDKRKLGPLYFLAPEMLSNPSTADGKPADVYSLIKTFWVLATGQNYPPPGQHGIEIPALTLSAYIEHPQARLLDRLIEDCTSHLPNSRPSMQEVATELQSWLKPPASPVSVSDLSDLSSRISASSGPRRKLAVQNQKLMKEYDERQRSMMTMLQPLAEAIAKGLGIGQLGFNQTGLLIPQLERYKTTSKIMLDGCTQNGSVLRRSEVSIHARIPGNNEVSLISGIISTLYQDRSMCLEAIHLVRVRCDEKSCPREMSWSGGMGFQLVGFTKKTGRLGSASIEQAYAEIVNDLTLNLRPAVERFLVALESLK